MHHISGNFSSFSNGVARFHEDFYTGFSLAVKLAKKQIFHPNSLASENSGVVYLSPGLPYADVPQYLETEVNWCTSSSDLPLNFSEQN